MKIFYAEESSFKKELQNFLEKRRNPSATCVEDVRSILDDIRKKGESALLEYASRYDGLPAIWHYDHKEIIKAKNLPANLEKAFALAAKRIMDFHQKQMPKETHYQDTTGVSFRQRWRPIDSVGIYAPGGRAVYPSSLLMASVTARVAGVKRLVVISPPHNGKISPLILAAARIARVDELYCVGGAHGIAALAFGTQSIAAVDHISGPGNMYVTEAKRQISSYVGIDMPAGPSEVVIVADEKTPINWLVADMLAQAEHDPQAQSIAIVTHGHMLKPLQVAMKKALSSSSRVSQESIGRWGACVVSPSLDAIPKIINRIAPEHVHLCIEDPEAMAEHIHHAGTIFMGRQTTEALGDYMLGSNHVLPTCGSARYCSGLSVYNFLKRITLTHCSQKAFNELASPTILFAEAEGLTWHAESVRRRLKDDNAC